MLTKNVKDTLPKVEKENIRRDHNLYYYCHWGLLNTFYLSPCGELNLRQEQTTNKP